MKEPIYFFMHLAKTGGTTFVGNLYRHMHFDEDFLDLGPHGITFRKENHRKELADRTPEELSKIRVIAGHLVYWEVQDIFPEREHRFITFLREPVSRVISHYTFDSSNKPETFMSWYSRWVPNEMYLFYCDHLRESTVKGVLEKLQTFWHIGLKENLDASLKQLYTELDIPTEYENRRVAGESYNTTKELGYDENRIIKQSYIPTSDEIALIRKDHAKDIWLYENIKNSLVNNKYSPAGNTIIPTEFEG